MPDEKVLPEVVAANMLLIMTGLKKDPLLEAVMGGAIIAMRALNEENQPSVGPEGMGTLPVGPGEVPSRDPQTPEGVEQAGPAS